MQGRLSGAANGMGSGMSVASSGVGLGAGPNQTGVKKPVPAVFAATARQAPAEPALDFIYRCLRRAK